MGVNCFPHNHDIWKVIIYLVMLWPCAKGRRFEVFNETATLPTACSIVEADLSITVAAFDGQTELNATTVSSDNSDTYVYGRCGHFMLVAWPDYIQWHLAYFGTYVDFSVLFTPRFLFGHLTPSTEILVYESPRRALVQSSNVSYKCSTKRADYYRRNLTQAITFTVFVVVKSVQAQFENVVNGTFSPAAGPECQQQNVNPPQPTFRPDVPTRTETFWQRNWLRFIVPLVGSVVGVVIASGIWNYFRRRQTKPVPAAQTERLV
ncbi:hypothetical protein ElyMa_001528100 [Elysia marginata]|uniref:Uncharacterized protein n=1 Tax=Elysia marginata TaxID=1093978 RepID=A0AAV4JDL8_9GAST|nr:hypothetical protein ElyMa_001528100 [Elysia marginata]